MIAQSEPVPGACCSDGIEGSVFGFRGATGSVAAVADEDARARLAGICSSEDRAGTEECFLDPPGCHHGVSNQSVLVVQVERQSHFVPTGPAEGESCPCRCGGIVDLSRNDKRECFGVDWHWMSGRRAIGSEAVKSGCDGHGGDLREKWIHGAEPVPQDEGGGPNGSPVARLEAGAHEAGGVQAKE